MKVLTGELLECAKQGAALLPIGLIGLVEPIVDIGEAVKASSLCSGHPDAILKCS